MDSISKIVKMFSHGPYFPTYTNKNKQQNQRNPSHTNSRTNTEHQQNYKHPMNSIWEADSSSGSQKIIL